jgi:DNA-binding CsgD family transcriptional regulator
VLAAACDEPERAIRLDRAGRSALEEIGARLAAAMRELYDRGLASAYATSGAAHAGAIEEDDPALPLDQAVDEALAWLGQLQASGVLGSSTEVAVASRPQRTDAPAPSSTTAGGAVRSDTGASVAPSALTRREREVVTLIAQGRTNREIAGELVISERTAGNYVQRVLDRLGLHNRAQVAAWAVQHGLHERSVTPPARTM